MAAAHSRPGVSRGRAALRSDRQRLLDVIEAVEEIEKYADRGKQAFEADDLLQTFIVHHIQILGEACRSISSELTATTNI